MHPAATSTYHIKPTMTIGGGGGGIMEPAVRAGKHREPAM